MHLILRLLAHYRNSYLIASDSSVKTHVFLCVASCANHSCAAPGCYSKCSATFQCLGAAGRVGRLDVFGALRCTLQKTNLPGKKNKNFFLGHVSFTSFFDGAIYFALRFLSSPRCHVRGHVFPGCSMLGGPGF